MSSVLECVGKLWRVRESVFALSMSEDKGRTLTKKSAATQILLRWSSTYTILL